MLALDQGFRPMLYYSRASRFCGAMEQAPIFSPRGRGIVPDQDDLYACSFDRPPFFFSFIFETPELSIEGLYSLGRGVSLRR
jgi:hypothetical protein